MPIQQMVCADSYQNPSRLPSLYFVREQFANYWTDLIVRVRQNDDCDRVYTGILPNPVILLQRLCSAQITGYRVPLVTDFDLHNNPLDAVIPVGEPQKRAGTAIMYSGTATRKTCGCSNAFCGCSRVLTVPAHIVDVPKHDCSAELFAIVPEYFVTVQE